MNYKTEILANLYYTELVYGRINKKLNLELSKSKIQELILTVISKLTLKTSINQAKTFT